MNSIDPAVLESARTRLRQLREEIGKAMVGQGEAIEQLLIALVASGHVLIEGVPGLGKTLLARALARAVALRYARIQFTPDMLPSDITGHAVLDSAGAGVAGAVALRIRRGPVFTHVLLADEINRAPAKTQSALLEVMQEYQVSLEGETLPVDRPFHVLATQNPVDTEGTYPLPEAQLDRFLMKIEIGYPPQADELAIVVRTTDGAAGDQLPLAEVRECIDAAGLLELQRLAGQVHVDERVIDYAVRIVRATRGSLGLAAGSGPRGGDRRRARLRHARRRQALLPGGVAASGDARSRCPARRAPGRRAARRAAAVGGGAAPLRSAMRLSLLPSRRAMLVALALAVLAAVARLLGAPAEWVDPAAAGVAALGIVYLAADALWTRLAWSRSPLVWQRELPTALPVGVERVLGGSLVNAGRLAWSVRLFEHVDATVEVRDLPATVRVPPEAAVRIAYHARAMRRGTIRIAPAELRLASRGGAWELRRRLGGEAVLRVYPNFAAVARYAWLAGDRRLAEIGIKSYPQRGHGTAFKQLADYRPGDPIRDVDWKASMRHGRPIVREYEDERDQRIVFMLDCGRRMRADEGPASGRLGHFDAALDALMLMSWVALKEGDAVGAVTFGGGPASARAVAPRKGLGALDALIATLHDVEPQPLQPDYRTAAVELMGRLAKRSLVIVLTNFRDEDASEFKAALSLLRTRHLVLVASLRERVLRELAEQPLVQARDAIEVAGAHLFAQARDAAFRRLAARHSLMLDVEPERLAVALVNRYHAVKRAGLL